MAKKKPRARKTVLTKAQKVRAAKAKHPGATPKQIAHYAQVDIQTVYRVNMEDAKKNGVQKNPKSANQTLRSEIRAINEKVDKILALLS